MTTAATAIAPVFSTAPSPAVIDAALDHGPLFSRGAVRDGVVSLIRSSAASTTRHPSPARFASFAEAAAQLLLPFPTHGLRPRHIEDPSEARALGERLGNATHYLRRSLASKELPSMTVLRTLARFVLETETAQLNEESRSAFLEGLRSVNRDATVKEAKLLVLLSVLRYEDRNLLGRYPTLVGNPNASALFTNLAKLLVALDRFTVRGEESNDRARLEAVVRLEKTFEALEVFSPWAKALFPAELQVLEARLAQRDLKLKDLIARGQGRVRIARAKLYRVKNGLPPLALLRPEPKPN